MVTGAGARRPTMAKIFDLLEGRLEASEAQALKDLAVADREFADSVEWARRFLALCLAMPLTEPPPELHGRLLAAFDSWAGMSPVASWIDGSLVLDSRTASGRGLRSAATEETVRLMFDSPIGSILLEITPAHAGFVDIAGRIAFKVRESGGPRGEVEVAITCQGALRATSRTTAAGQFELRAVAVDSDELWVTGADERVRLELDLVLG